MLTHLYVLVPVFDSQKHYFVGDDEMEKLLEKGKGWLGQHPEKEEITRRYLKFQPKPVPPGARPAGRGGTTWTDRGHDRASDQDEVVLEENEPERAAARSGHGGDPG